MGSHCLPSNGVVNQAGSNAQFEGTDRVNDGLDPNGNLYKFMLWAGDGSPDTFRIKIWREDIDGTDYEVYDNGIDQAISGGISWYTNSHCTCESFEI